MPQGPKLRSNTDPRYCLFILLTAILHTPLTVSSESTSCISASTHRNFFIIWEKKKKKKIFIASLCIGEQGIDISVICMSRIDHNIIMHTIHSSLPDLTQYVLTANFIIRCGFTVAVVEELFYRFVLHLHFDFQH